MIPQPMLVPQTGGVIKHVPKTNWGRFWIPQPMLVPQTGGGFKNMPKTNWGELLDSAADVARSDNREVGRQCG